MEKLGRQFRKLEEKDIPSLQEFCDTCKDLGYVNNQSFEAIKLDKMVMPYGQFFVGVLHGAWTYLKVEYTSVNSYTSRLNLYKN